MKIAVIGLGYIGLPTALMLADQKQQVIGIDINIEVVKALQAGTADLQEPGLKERLDRVLQSGYLTLQTETTAAEVFIVAVPTPNHKDRHFSCDLTYVLAAIERIIPVIQTGTTLIIESTIAPGTIDNVIKPMLEQAGFKIGQDIFLSHCPERVIPGNIEYELVHNERIIGGVTDKCVEAAKKVYQLFVENELVGTSAKTAEMAKLTENTYRDVNIAFANELARICNDLEIDVYEMIGLANRHPRVNIHMPGPGVGGHCLAVDPYFIISSSPKYARLIREAREINNRMPSFVVECTKKIMKKINGHKITILGITYKGNTSDTRESPALQIVQQLIEETDYQMEIFDPHVDGEWIEKDWHQAVDQSDLLVLLADHQEFAHITSDQVANMKQQVIFDTKKIVAPEDDTIKIWNFGNIHKINDREFI